MLSEIVAGCCRRAASAMALALAAEAAIAGPITPGNVVVYRAGDGVAGLANTGALVFIDEYTPGGSLVQSIAMPATGAGPKLVASGTASSEGLLTVSPSGRFITFTGYNSTIPAASSLAGTTSAAVNRSVGVLDATTGVTAFTLLSDFASGNSPRAGVTDDGNNLWVAGGAGGIRYTTAGSSTSTQINTPTALVNIRQVNIFDGQLYATTNSTGGGNTASIGTVGVGLPTAAGAAYATLPGIPPAGTIAGTSRYGFFFADLSAVVPGVDTVYVADDGALALSKYSFVGGNWVLNGTIGVAVDAYRSVTGRVLPGGSGVLLFAGRKGGAAAAGGGELVTLTDASGYNGAFAGAPIVLATAATNTTFRGVGLIPGGACCPGDGSCVLAINAALCNGAFLGQGTACNPNPCPLPSGACCQPDGSCVQKPSAAACNGTFMGLGVACGPATCVGACCLANGNCVQTTVDNCPGVYNGPGSQCGVVVCVVQSACCFPDGSCTVVNSPVECNGVLQGPGTTCNPNPCPQPVIGACCVGGICGIRTQAQCDAANGRYLGDGVPCAGVNCDMGACCFPNGLCNWTSVPVVCVNNGGSFLGYGTVCVPNPCPQPTDGACCFPDGSCLVTLPGACNGSFLGVGSTCNPNPCPQPITGACCVQGSCSQRTPNNCALAGGRYFGDGSLCTPNICTEGACCAMDGTCSIKADAAACEAAPGSVFQGAGTVCTPNPCPQPVACCDTQGTCTIRFNQCNPNELPLPSGFTCNPNPCPQPVACCNLQGICTVRVNQCNANEQQPGNLTSCTPNPCPQPGACCFQSGACQEVLQGVCNVLNGSWQGPGTVCQPNPCPQPEGACCCGSTCIITLPGNCTGPGRAFVGSGTTCTPYSTTVPCCRGDFNHSGAVSVQDIFDFLAAYFGNSPCADSNDTGTLSVQDLFDFLAAYFHGC